MLSVHTERTDNNITVSLAQPYNSCFPPFTSGVTTTPRDVITTPRDVITTPRDVITTPRDVITTPRDVIEARGPVCFNNSPGRPAFPTENIARYPAVSRSNVIVSPIAVYPTALKRRSAVIQHSTSSRRVTPSRHVTSLHDVTSPSQNFFTSPVLDAQVTDKSFVSPPQRDDQLSQELSPEHKKYLALSSLLIFSNLVATTTAAMRFNVVNNSN
jgi:hypothetical protein